MVSVARQPSSVRRRRLLGGLAAGLALMGCLYGGLCWWAAGQFYSPWRYPRGDWAQQRALGVRDVWLTAADGVHLHGWWRAAPANRFATLYLHGNGYNVTTRADHIRGITAAGSDVLVIDYRGYGKSDGRPSERGLYTDANAGYRYVVSMGKPVIIQGQSLGTAVAVDLAVRRPCAGLVLEMPFTSGRDIARRVSPLAPLVVWGFDSRAKISKLRAPLLIMHGDQDQMVPFSMGRELFAAAPEPKQFWTVPGAGHGNLVQVAGPAYAERLRSFYETLK